MSKCANNREQLTKRPDMLNTFTYTPVNKTKSFEQMYEESKAILQSYELVLAAIHREIYEHKRFVMEFERSVA